MRIAHVCLAAFYIDNFGYQENILPRIHKEMGHDVQIIASTENYVNATEKEFGKARSYKNEHGISVSRIPYLFFIPKLMATKIRSYHGTYRSLKKFNPDLIFLHDIQFLDLIKVALYSLFHTTKIVADTHTDSVNSGRGMLSRVFLHKIFYRSIIALCKRRISVFYATLPLRANFLNEVYGIEKHRIALLPFGADDSRILKFDKAQERAALRARFGISDDAILLVTGGKIDARKNIHIFVDEFRKFVNNNKDQKLHLLVFGKLDSEVEHLLNFADDDDSVSYAGWVNSADTFRYFWAADMAIFPGTHSVLWEEAIGLGTAAALHRWAGMEHLDLGGNCLWIEDGRPETISVLIKRLAENPDSEIFARTRIAQVEGPRNFSYSVIAERALSLATDQ